MLDKIISWALRSRLEVLVLAVLLSVVGFYQARQMPVDIFPDLNKPQVVIMTEAGSLSTEDVENQVTRPIEQMLNGATSVDLVRSQSAQGLSVVTVQFNWGTDIYRNRQIVQEKLQLVRGLLPQGLQPQMMPISSIMGQIQMISFTSKSGDTKIEDIRALVDNQLRYRLLSLPGVAKVVSIGGAPRQLQVFCDPDKLREHDVTLQEVEKAIRARNQNGEGGFLEVGVTAPVISVKGLINRPDELAQAVLAWREGRSIVLGDVARIEFGPSVRKVGEAGVNGKRAVLVTVMKQPGADTLRLTKEIEKAMAEIGPSLGSDIEINTSVFRQADFIERAISNVFEAVRDGGIMVVVVLLLFLMNVRISFITLTAIPLSIALAALVFAAFGLGINTMTLGGLAVAIGALVDDAIVDVENVHRRLKQQFKLPEAERQPIIKTVFLASSEVRKPILIGTILVIVVYLPIFFLEGMEGRIFAPIGLAYIISIAASLLIALTVTPVLCSFLLPASLKKKEPKDTFLAAFMKKQAERLIRFSIRFRYAVLGVSLSLVVVSAYLLSFSGREFLPTFNEGTVQVNMVLPPDTGLAKSDELGAAMERELMLIEDVTFVGRRSGRAEGDEHAEGVNMSEAIVSIDPKSTRSRKAILDEIDKRLAKRFPGVVVSMEQPLAHLISHMLSGVYAQVAIKVEGPDMVVLRRTAEDIQARLGAISGVASLNIEQQVLTPQISIVPRSLDMQRYGITVEEINELVELSLSSHAVSRLIDGPWSYPITVSLDQKHRRSLEDIKNLYLRSAVGGGLIRLRDVADVKQIKSYNIIRHDNAVRRMVVSHNISGSSLSEVVDQVQLQLDQVREGLPQGYSIRLDGQYEAQQKATKRILWLSLVALVLMVFILYTHFRSFSLSLQVMMSVPMAFVGGALYIVFDMQIISIATLVGLISLGGIAARNAILLIDHYLHLLRDEKLPFTVDTLVQAGRERLLPVVMTALTSGIALVPIALTPDAPGKEILYPVATVIIGGLISSTLLDFILTPALFWMLGRKALAKLSTDNDGEHTL